MLKGDLVMELQKQLTYYRGILLQKMSRVQEKEEIVEIMMVLAVGMLSGLFNPHQVAQQLGIRPKQIYEKLKSMSLYHWRNLLSSMMIERAIEELKLYQASSPSTQSRLQASLSVDDSLIKRLGKMMSYVWSWYSGQIHQVSKGQDLLGIVLKIGNHIIPISLVLVSKQGSANTSKPSILIREMTTLKASFLEAGIDITKLGISFDSWWLGEDFSDKLSTLGFTKQIICAKHCTQLKVGREQKRVAQHFFELELKQGWGHSLPAARLKGHNPKLGKVVVIFFNHHRSKAFAIVVPVLPLRTCEALRIWLNHPAVENFWKRLKHWLGQGQMHLQESVGAWSELCLRVLAYFLALRLFNHQVGTFNQLYHFLRRHSTFSQLIVKHFQPLFSITYSSFHS
jgi:hypothetical protein